jgi:hypothetical protein
MNLDAQQALDFAEMALDIPRPRAIMSPPRWTKEIEPCMQLSKTADSSSA